MYDHRFTRRGLFGTALMATMPKLYRDKLLASVGGQMLVATSEVDDSGGGGGPEDPDEPTNPATWNLDLSNAQLTAAYPNLNYFTTVTTTPTRIGQPIGNVRVNSAVNKRIVVFTDQPGMLFRINGFTFQGQHEFAQYNESDGRQPIVFDPSRPKYGMGPQIYEDVWEHTKFEVFNATITHSASDGMQFYSGNVDIRNYTARYFWADNTGLGSATGQPHTDGLHSIGKGSFDGLMDGFDLQWLPFFGMNCHIDGSTVTGAVLKMRYRNGFINHIGTDHFGTVQLPDGSSANFEAMQTAKTLPGQPYADRVWTPQGGYGIRFYPSKTTTTLPAYITIEDVEFGPNMVGPLWIGPGTVHLNISDVTMYRGINVYAGTNLIVDHWENVTIINPTSGWYQGPGT